MATRAERKKTFSPRNYPEMWDRYQQTSSQTVNRNSSKSKNSYSKGNLNNKKQNQAALDNPPVSTSSNANRVSTQITQPLPQTRARTGSEGVPFTRVTNGGSVSQPAPNPETRKFSIEKMKLNPASFFSKTYAWTRAHPLAVWALLLGLAFLGRFLLAGLQSAYMDESNFILAGRYLIEKHTVYAGILNWAYGSYLWAIVAGLFGMIGGLEAVRGFTAVCGILMTAATGLFAARILPRNGDGSRRWQAAFFAALLMAFMPTALALGRFGTYDSLAGTAFMGGFAFLIPANRQGLQGRNRRFELLAAAFLLFIAFLGKYLDAVYFPFISVALLWVGYKTRTLRENLAWFVAPLALSSLVYFLIFNHDLVNLLQFSTTYSDLASPQPWREYVGERLEIWLLGTLALTGWWISRRENRLAWVNLGGVLVLLAFQAVARPDFDFWKHSIYLIFFLAPLAGLAFQFAGERARWFFRGGRRHWKGINLQRVTVVGLVLGALALLVLSLNVSQRLVNFYPNLNPSLSAIRENTSNARTVLTNDGALRLYLYPRISTDHVTDPFFFQYRDQEGMAAYKAAVSDRYFDTVVMDDGSGPQGQQLREDLGSLLNTYYHEVYVNEAGNGSLLKIYAPRSGQITPPASATESKPGLKVYSFGNNIQGWGAMPENGDLQAGSHVQISKAQLYQGQPVLKFQSGGNYTFLGVKETLQVRQIKMWVYIEPDGTNQGAVPVGMAGFDQKWNWHDDGFKQTVTPGQWTELTWTLLQSSQFNEFGLKFAAQSLTAYLGRVEVTS